MHSPRSRRPYPVSRVKEVSRARAAGIAARRRRPERAGRSQRRRSPRRRSPCSAGSPVSRPTASQLRPHASAMPGGDAPAARPRDAEADHRDDGEYGQTPGGCGIRPRFGTIPVSHAAMFATVASVTQPEVQAGDAVDQQCVHRTRPRRARDDRDAERDAQGDQQEDDDDDGPLDREQLRRDEPQAVEHDRERDPPADRALAIGRTLARKRLPDGVGDQTEIDDRPDAERRAGGGEIRPLSRQLSALRVLDLGAAQSPDADEHRHERESER